MWACHFPKADSATACLMFVPNVDPYFTIMTMIMGTIVEVGLFSDNAIFSHRIQSVSDHYSLARCTVTYLTYFMSSPPLCLPGLDTDVIHMIKWTKPFLFVFAYCKRSKTRRWEGLGMRLGTGRNNIVSDFSRVWFQD